MKTSLLRPTTSLAALGYYAACHVPSTWRRMRDHHRDRPASVPPGGRTLTPRVVVTCTTIPSRISQLRPFLTSLYAQEYKPDDIILAIPDRSRREECSYSVPVELESDPNLTVLRVDRDWGPATKLIPTLLREDPDTLVISVDDDNIHHPRHLANLVLHATTRTDQAVGHRGHRISDFGARARGRAIEGHRLDEAMPVDILQGCGSLAVRPRFFDSRVTFYEGAPEEAFFVDDVWFSGHLARRGIPRFVVPLDAPWAYLSALNTFRSLRLDRRENRTDANNRAVIQHFASQSNQLSRWAEGVAPLDGAD